MAAASQRTADVVNGAVKRIMHRFICFGIGMPAESCFMCWRRRAEACRALNCLGFSVRGFICRYDGMDLGLTTSGHAGSRMFFSTFFSPAWRPIGCTSRSHLICARL